MSDMHDQADFGIAALIREKMAIHRALLPKVVKCRVLDKRSTAPLRPFEKLDEIDRIIARGEAEANREIPDRLGASRGPAVP